jgi:hypothetical protein
MSFDRYSQFREGNEVGLVPFGEIPRSSSDMYEIYRRGKTRLDKISYDYYVNPDYACLILQANPQYGSMEFSIPDGVELRIPFPLNQAISNYQKSIEEYNKLYN